MSKNFLKHNMLLTSCFALKVVLTVDGHWRLFYLYHALEVIISLFLSLLCVQNLSFIFLLLFKFESLHKKICHCFLKNFLSLAGNCLFRF